MARHADKDDRKYGVRFSIEDAQVEFCTANEQFIGIELFGQVSSSGIDLIKPAMEVRIILAEYPEESLRIWGQEILVGHECSDECLSKIVDLIRLARGYPDRLIVDVDVGGPIDSDGAEHAWKVETLDILTRNILTGDNA